MSRQLIVNADDFGLSRSVNRGIIECHERGILTSASLMVRQPAAREAAAYARKNQTMSVGLHLDLGEWIYQNGDWVKLYEVVPADDAKAVQREVTRQLDEFRRLVGRNPTHLDSHQHVHRNEPVRSIMLSVAKELGVILRDCHSAVRYCGDFYGQDGEGLPIPDALTTSNLTKILAALPPGVTELGCHPGYVDDLKSVYRVERELELRVLCNPAMREELKMLNITLRGFAEPAMK